MQEFQKVMLAKDANEIWDRGLELPYPMYASPKFDGIRCHIEIDIHGRCVPLTRANKPIPNDYIRHALSHPLLKYFDTEIIVGDPTDKDVFQKTQSGVMSVSGEPEFTVYVHDLVYTSQTFEERLKALNRYRENYDIFKTHGYKYSNLVFVEHKLVCNVEELRFQEMLALQKGYEGLILRNPTALYKQGRAGIKQCELLKVKRFSDAEAVIVGYEARLHNENPEFLNELGYMHRSAAKDFMRAMNELGSLIVEDPSTNMRFSIGSGFSSSQRVELWAKKEQLVGKTVTYKYFEKGVKQAPRFPVFKGFRETADLEDFNG